MSQAWRRGGPIDWTLRVLCGLYMLLMLASASEQALRSMPGTPLTTIGATLYAIPYGPPPLLTRVSTVLPGGSAERAGIRPGDGIRFSTARGGNPTFVVGQTIHLIVERNGVRREISLPIVKGEAAAIAVVFVRVAFLFAIAIAGLLFIRGWWQPLPMLMGMGLTGPADFAVLFVLPVWFPDGAGLGASVWALMFGIQCLALAALPAFSMKLYGAQHRPLPRWHWTILAILAMAGMIATFMNTIAPALNWAIPGQDNLAAFFAVAVNVSQLMFLAAVAYLIAGWLRSGGAARNQYRILVFAFLILPLLLIWYQIAGFLDPTGGSETLDWATDWLTVVACVVYPAMLAYAVLAQKLVDVGFVLNRTLVYGSISAILLVMFGLAERAADEFIQEQSRVESVLIQAGIAVGILLVFHRVRDFVEEHLEAFFFRSWHDNEAKLKRFVADATHITRTETLETGLVAELTRFTGGAAVALYRPGPASALRCAAGDAAMPGAIDLDDPALVRLRADRQPIEIGDTASTLPAALALPMFHRAQLIGVTLVAAKPREERYRPDEVTAMASAVHQLGLDLDALRIEELEAEANALRTRAAIAEARVERLA